MAETDYLRRLDDYHTELLSVAQLTAHLLDVLVDNDVEWQAAGAWLMKQKLLDLAENLPFPERITASPGEAYFRPEFNPRSDLDLDAATAG